MTQEQREAYERGDDLEGGGNREPVPEGYYLLLAKAEKEYQGTEYDGVEMTWVVQEPRGYKGKKIWDNFSYSPNSVFRWRQLWESTGYEHDSDTGELVENEEVVVAFVTQQIQEKGKNKGKVQNKIDEYFEPNDENRALCSG
jgi:hypothetical protein